MPNQPYAYWTVANGDYASMIETAIASARQVGVLADFHVWSEREVRGAITHLVSFDNLSTERSFYWFKLYYLKHYLKELPYDYFVWLDADTYFIRHPGDPLRLLQGSPVHSFLESDACAENNVREDWWGCPLAEYARLMRQCGVTSQRIFNVNAGYWIVQRDIIDTFYALACEFWDVSASAGYEFTEEAPLAYATHMLCRAPELHTLRSHSDIWGSDWTGWYSDCLPDGLPWTFEDYFTTERRLINPAIVHAMRSKDALVSARASLLLPSLQGRDMHSRAPVC